MRRKIPLVTGEVYHIYNRGVNKADIFFSKRDYQRFYDAAVHYITESTRFSFRKHLLNEPGSQQSPKGGKIPKVKILAYCFMPNHFHFLIKQIEDDGVSSYMRNLCNSYSHYINIKNDRVGPLFQGRFKNVLVKTQSQLLHVSRYIHLNPVVAELVADLKDYEQSSYLAYARKIEDRLIDNEDVLRDFKSANAYKTFVLNHQDYAKSLGDIRHLTCDL